MKVSEITEAELESYGTIEEINTSKGDGKELINHLRHGTLDQKAVAFALENIAINK